MSRVVFVGNIPYNLSEEQLVQHFSAVGAVVGFRLVFDRETGKAKGYGFCEYLDHETAQSAVRNLNGKEVGGRALRIDLADSDPLLEGKSTSFGEILDDDRRPIAGNKAESWLVPPGVPVPPGKTALDSITQTIVGAKQDQIFEVIHDMKTLLAQNPERARALLSAQPQLVFAMLQVMILNHMVEPNIITRLQDVVNQKPAVTHPPPPPHQSWQQQQQQQQQSSSFYPPPTALAGTSSGPPRPLGQDPNQPALDPQQQAMLMHVLSMTPEQINGLPAKDRDAILALRKQLLPGS